MSFKKKLYSPSKILRGVNIKEVAEYYGARFKSPTVGHCFCHNDHNPSLSISTNESGIGYFKCFSTGKSGNAISLVMQQENLMYKDAIKFLEEEFYNEF